MRRAATGVSFTAPPRRCLFQPRNLTEGSPAKGRTTKSKSPSPGCHEERGEYADAIPRRKGKRGRNGKKTGSQEADVAHADRGRRVFAGRERRRETALAKALENTQRKVTATNLLENGSDQSSCLTAGREGGHIVCHRA